MNYSNTRRPQQSQAQSPRPLIEVAHLVTGDVISVSQLSVRAERRAALVAAAVVLALTAVAGVIVGFALVAAHRVVYATGYIALWGAVGVLAAAFAGRRARERARRYLIGAAIDDDAFSSVPMALVRRTSSGYELTVTPGMTGRFDGGRSPLLVESLVRERDAHLSLPMGAQAELALGATTFVVRALAADAPIAPLGRGFARQVARRAAGPLQLTALASILLGVPAGARLSEADMRSAIPANATPWEIEKMLRAEAQVQARSLHQCFDVLPLECQRPGYVGVGLSLSREGEIRSRWIARSTFGTECPVEQCMSDVISTWFFEPLPESMNVVLPVQVLRTDKPLPLGPARAAANLARRSPLRNQVN